VQLTGRRRGSREDMGSRRRADNSGIPVTDSQLANGTITKERVQGALKVFGSHGHKTYSLYLFLLGFSCGKQWHTYYQKVLSLTDMR
jgi:hypothetical protein